MTEKKRENDPPEEIDGLEDLRPPQDPKGGQAPSEAPLRTPLGNDKRGGWDGNHNITSVTPRRRRRKTRR